jgi:hypothetical protein
VAEGRWNRITVAGDTSPAQNGRCEEDAMYYWNVNRLAEDLAAQRVSQEHQHSYLGTLLMIMWCLFMVLGSRDSSDFTYILGMIIIGGGVELCWGNNRKGDNRDFIPRFICLGCVVALRVLVCVVLPARILAYIVAEQWGYSLTIYLIPIVLFIYFWLLYYWIGIVSRGEVNRGMISSESEADSPRVERDTSN